jgi:hypothetical protein
VSQPDALHASSKLSTAASALAPATAFAEVEEHLPLIYAKRGLSAELPPFPGLSWRYH